MATPEVVVSTYSRITTIPLPSRMRFMMNVSVGVYGSRLLVAIYLMQCCHSAWYSSQMCESEYVDV